MVLTKKKRRSSLLMGLLLALLLGVAAGFFILAMPIRMLEAVTTLTRLSKLMVQAEPPISPNDRVLLAVLAGIVTAGIGWVMVDWLLFGRAGMSTLIRTREDDYEDEDEDAFRPTDPLDLVMPGGAREPDWSQPLSGDARRPLSARTDIGEPESFAAPFPFGAPQPGMGAIPPLPPIGGQLLPGAGVSAPPLQPNVPPLMQPGVPLDPFAPPVGAPATPAWGIPGAEAARPAIDANFDLPDRPGGGTATANPQAPAAPLAGMPSWLPAPGSRPDAVAPSFEAAPASDAPAMEPSAPPSAPVLAGQPRDPFAATPSVPPVPPITSDPPPLILSQPVPPLPVAEPAPPHGLAQPLAFTPPVPTFEPPPTASPPQPFHAPLPSVEPAAPVAPSISIPTPPARPAPASPGMDRARLEELLTRLEAKVHSRRAAAVAPPRAPAPVAAPPLAANPVARPIPAAAAPHQPAPFPFPPQRVEPPAGFAAPPPQIAAAPASAPPALRPLHEMPPVQPPAAINLGLQPQVAAVSPVAPVPAPGLHESRKEELLDQPLHVTLDLLRNMVKR
jgi:hypothetical protein